LLSENQAGRDEIQEKARMLEDIKNTYTSELKDKDEIIDKREELIEKWKEDTEQLKVKYEQEKQAIVEERTKEVLVVKEKLEAETVKREDFETK